MKKHFVTSSLVLSFISLAATFLINIQIAKSYLQADGKTRALFSITEMLCYGYQYYVALIGLFALITALFSVAPTNKKLIAIVLSVLSIAFVFARVWRLLV